ncbi:hypothetical protein BV494_07630 [Rahnella sikkimica]|uniref:MaoC-like domain-containing protein n=2 Tax=Rahnella sikkimica TaxID=1805933 RepID=A0A2L1UPE9_9GAMM|nr:hypothetical protein BV494_07630 [Rahnella sikkimica]
MSFIYSLRDAETWAKFSGDDNPIHFDHAEAKRLGLDGLCVHGMRAMLDIKTALSARMEKDASGADGFSFISRLREPVLCDQPYQLALSETVRRGHMQISGNLLGKEASGQVSISSKLTGTGSVNLAPVTQTFSLSAQTLTSFYQDFPHGGKPVAVWNFMDAVLFRQLVQSPDTLDTVRSILPEVRATRLREVFSLVQVVQTHHETRFSRSLLAAGTEAACCEGFDYAVLPTLVTGDKHSGLILLASLQAWRGKDPLMTVTVTLKTGPLTL